MLFRCVPCKLKIVINLLSATQNSKYKYIYTHLQWSNIFFTYPSINGTSFNTSFTSSARFASDILFKSEEPDIEEPEAIHMTKRRSTMTRRQPRKHQCCRRSFRPANKKNICSNHAKITVSSNTSIYMRYMHNNKTWEAECRVLKEQERMLVIGFYSQSELPIYLLMFMIYHHQD